MPSFPNLFNLAQVLHQPNLYEKLEEEEFKHLANFEKLEVGDTKLFHKKDDFDSQVFGVNVGKAEYLIGENQSEIQKLIDKFLSLYPYDYIIFRCSQISTNWIQILQKNGAIFLDTTVDMILPVNVNFSQIGKIKLREATKKDLPQLSEIATSFRFGRFFTDLEFQFGKEIHEQWIANCVQKKVAEKVYILQSGNQLDGFIAIKTEKWSGMKVLRVVLLGKHPISSQPKVAVKMLDFLKSKAQEEKYDLLSISTQGTNIPALRSYLQAGFLPYSTGMTMRWKRK